MLNTNLWREAWREIQRASAAFEPLDECTVTGTGVRLDSINPSLGSVAVIHPVGAVALALDGANGPIRRTVAAPDSIGVVRGSPAALASLLSHGEPRSRHLQRQPVQAGGVHARHLHVNNGLARGA